MNTTDNNQTTLSYASQTTQAQEQYVKPAIEVIEMQMEGVLCSSGKDFGNGGHFGR